jgi:hypothetical protein
MPPPEVPGETLSIVVKDDRSSNYLENAQVLINNTHDALFNKELPKTNLCGNSNTLLEPGRKYSIRISKEGFQDNTIELEMPNQPNRLEVRLIPAKIGGR